MVWDLHVQPTSARPTGCELGSVLYPEDETVFSATCSSEPNPIAISFALVCRV